MKAFKYKFTVLIILAISTVACGGAGIELSKIDSASHGNGKLDTILSPGDLGICSALDFDGVLWPENYKLEDQRALALALNVTGSFEGHAGWSNLSNNFDGQGFSMGLLNQNLGQGSIQPMLIAMRDNHKGILENAMTPAMLASMLKMLAQWEKDVLNLAFVVPNVPFSVAHQEREPVNFFIQQQLIGEKIDKRYSVIGPFITPPNKKSVTWAKKNIYTSRSAKDFKPEWKSALLEIVSSKPYISLQIEAAQYLHIRAMEYKERLEWKQTRAYMFLFDIATQNGTLKDKHFDKFAIWKKKNPNATEEQQILRMLEIRVVDSNPKWQDDVRKRKTLIVKGTGFVHGEDRNLPVEYCYDPIRAYPEITSP